MSETPIETLSETEKFKRNQLVKTKQWHDKHKAAMAVVLKPGEFQCSRCHTVFTEAEAIPAKIYGTDKDGKKILVYQSPFQAIGCPGCRFPISAARKYVAPAPKTDAK